MKIIKQNDSAGGLIFKQNTSGKTMKQNYNFGSGFFGSPLWARCDDFNLDTITIYITWGQVNLGTAVNGIVSILSSTSDVITFTDRINTLYVNKINSSTSNQTSFPPKSGRSFLVLKYSATSNIIKITHNGVAVTPPVITTPGFNVNSVFVCNGYFNNNSTQYVGKKYITDISIYNRETTSSEDAFWFNNFLSNDLLSSSGLVSRYDFSTPEILDNEIIIKDLVSSNNLLIQALPAGDINAKLEYAKQYFL